MVFITVMVVLVMIYQWSDDYYLRGPGVVDTETVMEEPLCVPSEGPRCSYTPLINESRTLPFQGQVCIVVRSYWRHVDHVEFPLARFLHCLEQFEYDNWQAFIFVVDDKPAPGIREVIERRNSCFQERIKLVETPIHKAWSCPIYNSPVGECGYEATDWVISHVCPNTSRWLLVTNGDNEYHPKTLSYLDTQFDAIAFEGFFFSIYNTECGSHAECYDFP